MSSHEQALRAPRKIIYAAGTGIIPPQNDRIGRSIIAGKDNADVLFCMDSRNSKVRAKGKSAPGATIWGEYNGISEEKTAARLKGAGIRAVTSHPDCGMAFKAAKEHQDFRGSKVTPTEADSWASDRIKGMAKRNGLGFVRLDKADMCDNCGADHSTTTILRAGVPHKDTRDFRIDASVTVKPEKAARIAHEVGVSRGVTERTNRVITTSQRDAAHMTQRLQTVIPDAKIEAKIIKPRR